MRKGSSRAALRPRCGFELPLGRVCGRAAEHTGRHLSEVQIAQKNAYQVAYDASPEGVAAKERMQAAKRDRHAARVACAQSAGCADCGEKAGLDFHHLDPSTKAHNVAQMTNYADGAFEAEVAKCVVLCKPCHRARHQELRAFQAA